MKEIRVRRQIKPTPTFVCVGCGSVSERKVRKSEKHRLEGGWNHNTKFCSAECYQRSRLLNGTPKAAGYISKDGYRIVHVGGGKKRKMHSIVMEGILGRPLMANENVHHINGIRSDNRPENLELWVKSQPCGQRVSDRIDHSISFLREHGIGVETFNKSEAICGIAGLC